MERRVEGRKTLQLRRPRAVPSPCPGLQQPPRGASSSGTPTSGWVWGDRRIKPRLPALPRTGPRRLTGFAAPDPHCRVY